MPAKLRLPGKDFLAPSQSVIELESTISMEDTLNLSSISSPTMVKEGVFSIKSASKSFSMLFNLFLDKRS